MMIAAATSPASNATTRMVRLLFESAAGAAATAATDRWEVTAGTAAVWTGTVWQPMRAAANVIASTDLSCLIWALLWNGEPTELSRNPVNERPLVSANIRGRQ